MQNCTKEQQGKCWPLLLPGTANKINKSYHFTIDDIPFRVYRNRDPETISSLFIPDDAVFSNILSTDNNLNTECLESDICDSDEDSIFLDCPYENDTDATSPLSVEAAASTDQSILKPSYQDLMQSCLGSSLSGSVLYGIPNETANCHGAVDIDPDHVSVEEEFSSQSFSAALFSLTEKSYLSLLMS